MLAEPPESSARASRSCLERRPDAPGLRSFSGAVPRAVLIGASIGGIDAICDALVDLARLSSIPIVVTLHIQPDYGSIVARQVARAASRPCVLALDGAPVRRDAVHLVPGGAHWRVTRSGARVLFRRERGKAEGITPSVDLLFCSAAKALGAGALGVVLTGMGVDGLVGASAIVGAGGSVVAQDKGSSVVWGMPGAVAQAGLASAILRPSDLGRLLLRQFPGLARQQGL